MKTSHNIASLFLQKKFSVKAILAFVALTFTLVLYTNISSSEVENLLISMNPNDIHAFVLRGMATLPAEHKGEFPITIKPDPDLQGEGRTVFDGKTLAVTFRPQAQDGDTFMLKITLIHEFHHAMVDVNSHHPLNAVVWVYDADPMLGSYSKTFILDEVAAYAQELVMTPGLVREAMAAGRIGSAQKIIQGFKSSAWYYKNLAALALAGLKAAQIAFADLNGRRMNDRYDFTIAALPDKRQGMILTDLRTSKAIWAKILPAGSTPMANVPVTLAEVSLQVAQAIRTIESLPSQKAVDEAGARALTIYHSGGGTSARVGSGTASGTTTIASSGLVPDGLGGFVPAMRTTIPDIEPFMPDDDDTPTTAPQLADVGATFTMGPITDPFTGEVVEPGVTYFYDKNGILIQAPNDPTPNQPSPPSDPPPKTDPPPDTGPGDGDGGNSPGGDPTNGNPIGGINPGDPPPVRTE